jgi:[protein-PII] uridylyltransferase
MLSMNTQASDARDALWLNTLDQGREERRRYLIRRLRENPVAGVPEAELQAHLEGMPGRYWERVSESELVWGLRTIHTFLENVVSDASPPWIPIVDWRHVPERGFTKVLVCTWDRRGLLAKIAAAFSAVRINVTQADVFTRADNVVLDVFRVRDGIEGFTPDSSRLQQMSFLLEGSLAEPPRFASTWAGLYHKFLPYPEGVRPLVVLDNQTSPEFTIVNIEASDRLGLLYDILHVLDELRLNVAQADIDTDDDIACDVLCVTDVHGRKIVDPSQLRLIGDGVREALMAPVEAA